MQITDDYLVSYNRRGGGYGPVDDGYLVPFSKYLGYLGRGLVHGMRIDAISEVRIRKRLRNGEFQTTSS